MYYIGIDNGVTGSIGIINADKSEYLLLQIPVKKGQDYTKKKKNISRIDHVKLKEILKKYKEVSICIERPMVNSTRFVATTSALRALESLLVILEQLDLSRMFKDSKEWQKELLPIGIKGTPQLKKASLDIGIRLFPKMKEQIIKQKDADGLLIAEYIRRKQL
jgi:Holliday junction resolvasome RuvABC endonuclease subunit